jgi:hypothetical protein
MPVMTEPPRTIGLTPVPTRKSGPIRKVLRGTVDYVDWIGTSGRIVLFGYPTPRDISKRAASATPVLPVPTEPTSRPTRRGLIFLR